MHLSQTILVFSSFWATSSFAGITNTQLDKSILVDAAVQILESCYGSRITPVGLAGNLTGTISKSMWSRGISPTTLINDTPRPINIIPGHPHQTRYKLQIFVTIASSSITLTKTLSQIKESIWWNHMATFLILDWSPSNPGCSNAFEMLWAAWEMDILNAKLLCLHRKQGRRIYTFNPYTHQAPGIWQVDRIISGKNDHPWTLFVRSYEDVQEACVDLDFEKTNDLGGYKIRLSVTNMSLDDLSDSDRVCGGAFDQMICDILLPALNAIPEVLAPRSLEYLGYVDDEGVANGILGEVMNGSSDASFFARYVTSLKNLPMSYPHWQSHLRIMTQYRGFKSQLSKIVSVVDIKARFGLCLVCLINVLFFKYVLHQPTVVGYMSTLRIVCNACVPKMPRKAAPRIYLGCLFLFAITMQGIYQGSLASLLTKQEPLRNVDTKKDLVELDYKIYASTTYSFYFSDSEFQGRFFKINEVNCTEYPLRNHRAACVSDVDFLIHDAAKYSMYMSTDSVVESYMALPIRQDWPLERRVNTILKRAFESYCLQLLYEKATEKLNRALKIRENEFKDKRYRILTLHQLNFAFAILGIGLGCATISFAVEVGVGRFRRFYRILIHLKNKFFR